MRRIMARARKAATGSQSGYEKSKPDVASLLNVFKKKDEKLLKEINLLHFSCFLPNFQL